MDRMLYVGMSGAKESMLAQTLNNNNLANVSTTGFRADLEQFRSQWMFGPGHPTRAYALTERPGIDYRAGPIEATGRDLDMAIRGNGWFAVQARDGTEAYTRAGNFQIDNTGFLKTSTGEFVLGNDGPISIPPAETISFGSDGTITVKPRGQGGAQQAVVNRLKMVNPPRESLIKSEDGYIRLENGGNANADAAVRMESGFLERSNVNVVDSLVKMITLQRNYDMQLKSMKTADEIDQSSTSLLRAS